MPYSGGPSADTNFPFHYQLLFVGLVAVYAVFADQALLFFGESRMLRKIQKRQEVSIACSDEPRVERLGCISGGNDHANRSELCLEHSAFSETYVVLSKDTQSSPSQGFVTFYRLWLLYFDTVVEFLPETFQLALQTNEGTVCFRLMVTICAFRVLGAWPFPSSRKVQFFCTRLVYLSLFLLCFVYTLSIVGFGTGTFYVSETTRCVLFWIRIAVAVSQTLILLFSLIRRRETTTDVARKILKCQGELPEGSAPDQVFNKVRSTCFLPAPVCYPLSALDCIVIASDAFIFASNAVTWGSRVNPLGGDKIARRALVIDIILEPLVSQLHPRTAYSVNTFGFR